MKTPFAFLRAALALAFTLSLLRAVEPPGILNHQGRIAVSGANYTGTGHFKFALVDAAGTTTLWSNNNTSTGGGQPTAAVQVIVSQGHYALGLGDTALANMTAAIPASVFTGNADVRLRVWFSTNGTTFEQLTPDRRITAAGYALTAGAVADPSFLGTTTNTPLDLSVNNLRGLRLEFGDLGGGSTGVNVIGGYSGNVAGGAFRGATIAGGGDLGIINKVTSSYGTVGGGRGNTAGFHGTVAGGEDNTASGPYSTVPGGSANAASGQTSFAAGFRAKATNNGAFVWADSQNANFTSTAPNQFLIRAAGFVGINKNNPAVALDVNGTVRATAFEGMGVPLLLSTTDNQPLSFSVNGRQALRLQPGGASGIGTPNLIGGDAANTITSGSTGSVIGGGGSATGPNSITNDAINAVIAGGNDNIASANDAFIGGGAHNRASGLATTVAGGNTNTASGPRATVAGGISNVASDFDATVGGGINNVASALAATVPGGNNNTASGAYSFAVGRQAKAMNDGAFVWADSQAINFSSTANDQFNVRAAGGARLFTGGTGLNLDSDSVVFSGSAQVSRFGPAAGFDFNTGDSATSSGLLIEQGLLESSGIFFDGDSITMWSPGDNPGNGGRLLRILDEDLMGSGAAAAEKFYIDGTGGFGSAGSAAIAGSATISGTTTVGGALTVNSPATITGNATVGGALTVNSPATITGNATVGGTLQQGSGTGTSETPNRSLITRRINSTNQSAGQVVARTNFLTLERDGTPNGFVVKAAVGTGQLVIAAQGVTGSGGPVSAYDNLNANGFGTTRTLWTNAQNVCYFRVQFGNPFNAEEQTTVEISCSNGDNFWTGVLTSTFNQ